MENFTYYNRTKIIYGRGTEKEVGAEARKLADKVLLHFGGGSIKRSGLYDTVVVSLREHGVKIVELGGVVPNPRLDLVREGIELCRRENITLILAVGGGSVVDSAKAIAMGVHEKNGDVWENFISRKPIQKAVDVATILTLPATGSEASPNTVITDDATQLKLGYGSELLRPVFSILNPELFFTLPRNQIANGICDMMCHIFERYFTLTPKVELTDALCEATLRTIIDNAYKLADNPQDYDAWAEIGFAGTLAHNNLLGLGRVQDWASHGMEHEISALYDVAHGAGLATVVPSWMRYVYKTDVARFARFAKNVFGISETAPDGTSRDDEALALAGIDALESFWRKLGLPTTMSELGIPDDSRFEEMARKAVLARSSDGKEIPQGNFRKLYSQDILAIYKMAEGSGRE